ncbi:zf-HC2 domain-containing protein [Maricaulis sp.]|uniref:anti-sigma factor family protein n=1 Tax=Maricaulis sp. TaxID=1486257 RepID=UPI00262327DF|nr:zf-HC2 domain-containing protein [Maricaulis sp.]
MTIEEDMLMAYVDGELDAAAAARVETALANDPELKARFDAMQALRGTLSEHYDPVLDEPVPARLEALIRPARAARPRATAANPVSQWLDRLRQGWQAPQWAAVAAALVLGVLAGTQLGIPGDRSILTVENGRLAPGGPLAAALDRPGPGRGDIAVQVSFRRADGRYCRTFTASDTAGIACRDAGAWQIELAAPAAGQETEIRTAGSALPPAVLEHMDVLIEGDALSAEEEISAAERGWRPE